MNSQYGSEWRKWDFHVHTPYSLLNNQYGINPYDEGCDFDTYVKELFTRAVDNDIAAIGITDYFMIEGYKRIRNEYLSKPEKMRACFPDEELRKKVAQIYVFPNIEFRIDTFVGEHAHSVNYHILFSDKVSIQEIEDNFLHKLTLSSDYGMQRTLTVANIEAIGRMVKESNGDKGSDLLVGLSKITVKPQELLDTLHASNIFTNQYFVAIPVDEDLSAVSWSGRDYLTRKTLYHQCDCYMSANPGTRTFALAVGEEDARKREFGSIKPCIWGSDAHEYVKMFEPDMQRYCWVKSDTTFEGLLQILYEPAERVRIQKDKPDCKDPHQIIESITFEDERFQPEPIPFNDNLTCIIGGKSTGKSLLLRQLAASIDSEHVSKREKSVATRGTFQYPNATVRWKDGTVGIRKIVYIPQTFLNRTVDDSQRTTEITQIIEGVLRQEPAIATAFEDLKRTLHRIRENCHSNISKFCIATAELKQMKETILREGSSSTYKSTIDRLEDERSALAEKSDVSQEEIDRYTELDRTIQDLRNAQVSIKSELESLRKLKMPTVVIPGQFETTDGLTIRHDFGSNLARCANELLKTIEEMSAKIQPDWVEKCEHMKLELTESLVQTGVELLDAEKEFSVLKDKVERNEQMQRIALQLTEETKRYTAALERESAQSRLESRLSELRANIIASQHEYHSAYSLYSNTVRSSGTISDTALEFDAQVVWKKKDFTNGIVNIFDNRNFSAFRSCSHFDLQELSDSDYDETLLSSIFDAMNTQSWGGLTLKSAFSVEQALNNVFQDWYNIHYVVVSGSDTIEQMSPGKKALVLLELLINLEENKCPILIDQPEDDLDNRSIYYDLVQFIRNPMATSRLFLLTYWQFPQQAEVLSQTL